MRAPAQAPPRRTLRDETLLVLGVSLGSSAVYSLVSLIAKLSAGPLSRQTATLNPSQAPGRPWLDLTYQLLGIFFALVPAALAVHLLARYPGRPSRVLGLRPRRVGHDLTTGVTLAALVGIPGLGLYLASLALGVNTTVAAAALPHVWWAVPVLTLSAVQNALLEEVVVVGYLMNRLGELGLSRPAVVAVSALLRGAYHLYQGFGAFAGNALMGVLFAVFFLRQRRLGPLVVAHALLDLVAFVGYALFASHLGFLR